MEINYVVRATLTCNLGVVTMVPSNGHQNNISPGFDVP